MDYVLDIMILPADYCFKKAGESVLALGRHIHDHFIPNARNNYHPHVLGHRALGLFSAVLVAMKIFVLAVLAFGAIQPAFSSAITPVNIISLTNASRQQYNEQSLTENSELDQAAQAKANDMLAKGYFAHVTPDGRTPWSFVTAAGYNYLMAGENLAVNFTEAEDVETAWMNSPDHRANILNADFQDIGVGISQGVYQGHNAIFVVQEFGTPAAQAVAINNQPTPVQTAAVPAPAVSVQTQSVTPAVGQIRGASSAAPAAAKPKAATPAAMNVSVQSGSINLDGSNVDITARIKGPAVKVIAYFGQQAIMLLPQSQTQWSGSVAASELTQSSVTVKVEAFNIDGQTSQLRLADFAPTTASNYNVASVAPAAPSSYVSFFGPRFDPNAFEYRFYLLFIAAMLVSLILAIGIKRHVQHLPLIANCSFVIILAVMLWWGG